MVSITRFHPRRAYEPIGEGMDHLPATVFELSCPTGLINFNQPFLVTIPQAKVILEGELAGDFFIENKHREVITKPFVGKYFDKNSVIPGYSRTFLEYCNNTSYDSSPFLQMALMMVKGNREHGWLCSDSVMRSIYYGLSAANLIHRPRDGDNFGCLLKSFIKNSRRRCKKMTQEEILNYE